jgi:hypothetical protein
MQDGFWQSLSAHSSWTQDTPTPVTPAEPVPTPTDGTTTAAPATNVDLVVDVVDVAAPPLPMSVQTSPAATSSGSSSGSSTAVVAAQGPVPQTVLPTTGAATGIEVLIAVALVVSGLAARALGRRDRSILRSPVA